MSTAHGTPSAARPAVDPDLRELDPRHLEALLLRYAGPGPRYTSYPTVPAWSEDYAADDFRSDLGGVEGPAPDLSVYVHVPFCRSLCHFCACNRVVTRRADLPERYLDTLEREVDAVAGALPEGARAAQVHWGGGTPTHLSPEQIRRLAAVLRRAFPPHADAEISVEVDPRVTGPAHLEALRECGFTRLSLGVQDFDPRVQRAIHRIQPAAETRELVESARRLGFGGINLDLIYGLPLQSAESFERTLDTVLALAPDRLALYGYAHVTWVARQQRGFEEADLPDAGERLRIFSLALRRLLGAGYEFIGLDHFARPDDELARARREGGLHRNFMGYTTRAGLDLVGVGPSAISELGGSYAQSRRDLTAWHAAVEEGGLATFRGHRLTPDDRERRFVIGSIMCHGEVRDDAFRARFGGTLRQRFAAELARLEPLADEGLVELGTRGVRVTSVGRLVLRNVAMAFDAYLPRQQQEQRPLFSQTL